tara:strand:- start:2896 stop:3705 length:810 start_codon:yes stop_codon:yes gene_type:complete
MSGITRCFAFILVLYSASSVSAELELGAGIFHANIPLYIGARESKSYTLPVPYVRYRSERLNLDRRSATGYLWQHNNWHLDISATAGIAVDSGESKARDGMDDLDWVFELGPALDYYVVGHYNQPSYFKLGVFTRKALATDFTSIDDIGFKAGPYAQWRQRLWQQEAQSITLTSRLAVNYASSQYADYFYAVPTAAANSLRSEYTSGNGYGGEEVSLGLSYDSRRWWFGGFVKYYRIKDAKWRDSPLVERNHSVAFGFGLAWKFYNNRG